MILDQVLHFLWAIAATLPLAHPRTTWHRFSLPWFVTNWAFIVLREALQWPSSRPWDPWTDWAFFVLGFAVSLGVGAWARRRR